jgi:hypothetical protein
VTDQTGLVITTPTQTQEAYTAGSLVAAVEDPVTSSKPFFAIGDISGEPEQPLGGYFGYLRAFELPLVAEV